MGADPGDATPDLRAHKPRAAVLDKEGLAFVNIKRGEVYSARVTNRADHDVAATLAIDGLTMFAFSENRQLALACRPVGDPARSSHGRC